MNKSRTRPQHAAGSTPESAGHDRREQLEMHHEPRHDRASRDVAAMPQGEQERRVAEECVVGVYATPEDAQAAVQLLRDTPFPAEHISLITATRETGDLVVESLDPEAKFGDDSVRDAFLGAGLGGVLGSLVGASLAAISGVGIILVAGPAAGFLTGVVVGGFLGGMEGWGVHKQHQRHYEKQLQAGHALVVARGNPLEVKRAHDVLQQTPFEELNIHARSSDDAAEVDDRPD